MLKVLLVTSEAVPFAKTGGLADVAGSLPKALEEKDVDERVIMPLYGSIPDNLKQKIEYMAYTFVKVGWRNQYCGIKTAAVDGIKYYFIDNEYYFKRDNLYGYFDDAERFAFFCMAVLAAIPCIDFSPDILHCNDWQTGMIPVYLKTWYSGSPDYKSIKVVFTIHNIEYQGTFDKNILGEILNLSEEFYNSDKLELYGGVSFMKGGLAYSDMLSTVSPKYSEEIQYPFYGKKLEGLLNSRRDKLKGILNGIDCQAYNPSADPFIFSGYDADNPEGKKINKQGLQKLLGLNIEPDIPVVGIVSRLVSQKGLDLIECVIDEIMKKDLQMVVLGTGEGKYESLFINKSNEYRGRLSANIRFDNALSHKIYAGADLFLMPSLYEPCGLGQMIALRYGTIPVVRETGGLYDTVKPFNEYTMEGNGFSFTNYNAHDMLYTIERAVSFYQDKRIWNMLVKRAMSCDYSWDASALKYKELYTNLSSE